MEKVIDFFEFLWKIFCNMWSNGLIGIVFGVATSLAAATLIGFLLFGIFKAIDSWFLPKNNGIGSIQKKEYQEPSRSLRYDVVLKMPIAEHSEAIWILYVSLNDKTYSTEVNEDCFNSVEEGQIINISYVIGRISKRLYLKNKTWQ